MTAVLVHGAPETREVWDPLRRALKRESIALALPGFGSVRPRGFTATKDAYADWLAQQVKALHDPVDLVGHDFGALLTLRLATAPDGPSLRSWIVDVANIFHPQYEWFARASQLQVPEVGEEMLRVERHASPDDPHSTTSQLRAAGVPKSLAISIAAAHNESMSRSILDFYRSAMPNVAAAWWREPVKPTRSPGLVLLLPDSPEDERKSREVATRLGARTARLDGLGHCWMAQDSERVAATLERFWANLDRAR
jgi:pimeloyl-ACP methyl ester carboxylesterase